MSGVTGCWSIVDWGSYKTDCNAVTMKHADGRDSGFCNDHLAAGLIGMAGSPYDSNKNYCTKACPVCDFRRERVTMKIKLTCLRVEFVREGPIPKLQVQLHGGPFVRNAKLSLDLAHPTSEQRHAFVVGEVYEIDVPDMPEHPHAQSKGVDGDGNHL